MNVSNHHRHHHQDHHHHQRPQDRPPPHHPRCFPQTPNRLNCHLFRFSQLSGELPLQVSWRNRKHIQSNKKTKATGEMGRFWAYVHNGKSIK